VLLALAVAVVILGATREASLRKVVERGNEAWIKAGRTLDKAVLEPFFAGEAFTDLSQILASSREDQMYMDLELIKVDYRTIVVDPDGRNGSVTVSEFWRVTWRHVGTDQCEVILKPRERRQTYQLSTTDEGWRIVRIIEEPNLPKIETEECPG
jgi:hypothetical protein